MVCLSRISESSTKAFKYIKELDNRQTSLSNQVNQNSELVYKATMHIQKEIIKNALK